MKLRTRHIAAIAATATVTAVLLAGCTSAPAPTAASAGSSSSASVLPAILSSHTITIGLTPGGAPLDSINGSGKPVGFEVDLANALAKSLGATPKFVIVSDPAGRVAALQSKKVQVEIANFTVTAVRTQTISFSQPYMLPSGQFMVKAGSNITSYKQLNDPSVKICIGGQGSTAEQLIPLSLPKAKLVVLNSATDCAQAVTNGQATATSQDELANYGIMKATPGAFQIVTGGSFTTALVGVGLQLNDFQMQNYVNAFIQEYIATNQLGAMFNKWWPGFQGAPPLAPIG